MSGTKIKSEQRLKGSHNSWEEERAEAQHMKAETESWKGPRNQINKKGETQEKRHKNKQESVSLMRRSPGTTLVPLGWHLYLSDTLEGVIRQDGLEIRRAGIKVLRKESTRHKSQGSVLRWWQ